MKLNRLILLLAVLFVALTAQANTVVLGKLGQSIEDLPIYSKTDTRSRVYYKCEAFEYLVIKPTRYKAWYAVLLKNGRYGYIQSQKVAELPFEVTSEKPIEVTASRVSPQPSRSRAAVADYSLNYQGVKYVWGGTDMEDGVDCSGFMKGLFAMHGMKLPRTAAEQVRVGQPITRLEDLQKGDRLYFWSSKRKKIGHTGIYLGNGYFCHASSSNGKVVTSRLNTKYWLSTLVAARR